MRVLLVTFGSRGDVHPFLAVAAALRRRGHDPVIAAPRVHEGIVVAEGLRFVEAYRGVDVGALIARPDVLHRRGGRWRVFSALADAVPRHFADCRSLLRTERFDVVATHPFAVGTAWACEEEGVPWLTAALSPMAWYARTDPVPLVQRSPGRWRFLAGRVVDRMTRRSVRWIGSAMLNRLRRHCGLPPMHRAFQRTLHGGAANLGLWSTHFRAATAMDPARSAICGFAKRAPGPDAESRADAPGEGCSEALRAALDGGADDVPLVVFSLGTTAVHASGDFFDYALEACRELGCRGVLLAGAATAALNEDPRRPANVLAASYVPLAEVLVAADLFVHHGGIGSVAEAIASGVPSLVVPHAFDQFHNALHVERLGLGLVLPRQRVQSGAMTARVADLLRDGPLRARCRSFADRLAGEDGATRAAEEIERVGRRTTAERARGEL
jgi:rhamnosyltransferase subunit B